MATYDDGYMETNPDVLATTYYDDGGTAAYLRSLQEDVPDDWDRPYLAANGHTMQRTQPTRTWNAACADDCAACRNGEERPDW